MYSLQHLQSALEKAPACQRYVIGLSGGMDSVVLLQGMHRLVVQGRISQQVAAIHVHHGLHAAADGWQSFCESLCQQWQIPLRVKKVAVAATGSEENTARTSRYEAFAQQLEADDVLLLAHHLDDQLETLLLRLMRGAGPAGLAAMPVCRAVGKSSLFRPLLEVSRVELQEYAAELGLQWMEDGSNADLKHDRNFLRQQVLPVIGQRWPGYRASWSKSVALLQETGELLSDLAAQDLSSVRTAQGALRLSSLIRLSEPRQRNLLRCWLKELGLPEPGWNILQHLTTRTLCNASASSPVESPGCCLQVFNDGLYALQPAERQEPPSSLAIDLSVDNSINLPANGSLSFQQRQGTGISSRFSRLQVRFRDGGESLQLQGRPAKSLKKLFQEHRVPPWLRDRMPLLYLDGVLVCVPDLGVAEAVLASPDETGITVHWHRPDLEISAAS